MAKVVATFDTVTKEFTFSLGEAAIPMDMLDYVSFGKGCCYDAGEEPVWRCMINMSGKDKQEGIAVQTTIYAKEKEPLDGVTITEGEPQLHKSVANLYRSKYGSRS